MRMMKAKIDQIYQETKGEFDRLTELAKRLGESTRRAAENDDS